MRPPPSSPPLVYSSPTDAHPRSLAVVMATGYSASFPRARAPAVDLLKLTFSSRSQPRSVRRCAASSRTTSPTVLALSGAPMRRARSRASGCVPLAFRPLALGLTSPSCAQRYSGVPRFWLQSGNLFQARCYRCVSLELDFLAAQEADLALLLPLPLSTSAASTSLSRSR